MLINILIRSYEYLRIYVKIFIYFYLQIAKKLVSRENGYKQMFIVLKSFAVLFLNLIGQNKYSCQNPDQAKALLERGQKWSQGPNFDHFAQCEKSILKKRQITAKRSQKCRSMTIFN